MVILGILAPTIAAVIVASSGGINAQGIRPLYYLQLVITAFVFLFLLKLPPSLSKVDPKRDGAGSKETGFIQDFRDLIRGKRWLKRWIVLLCIRNFGMKIAMPFIPLWMVNVKLADPYILGIMGTLGTIIGVILQIPVGRLSDTIGRKKSIFFYVPFSM